jgi:hypothetical protein
MFHQGEAIYINVGRHGKPDIVVLYFLCTHHVKRTPRFCLPNRFGGQKFILL